jgi:uncharacterized protein YsxB (DUF464 family)
MDGHALYSEGDDIVCAAATSAMWMTVNGIENVANIPCGYETGDGHVYFVLPDDLKESELKNTDLLLESFFLYIKELESQYPDHIKVTELEV